MSEYSQYPGEHWYMAECTFTRPSADGLRRDVKIPILAVFGTSLLLY